jgi:hypothetical protein
LLIVFWITSYDNQQSSRVTEIRELAVEAFRGQIGLVWWDPTSQEPGILPRIAAEIQADKKSTPISAFALLHRCGLTILVAPFWFAILISIMAATLPWIQWSLRFRLRTLLIATTLVAVVLGLICYAVRTQRCFGT